MNRPQFKLIDLLALLWIVALLLGCVRIIVFINRPPFHLALYGLPYITWNFLAIMTTSVATCIVAYCCGWFDRSNPYVLACIFMAAPWVVVYLWASFI